MIAQELYQELKKITEEEHRIQSGKTAVEMGIYTAQEDKEREVNIVDAKRLLESGKLIQVRPHTRFVHFPAHKHNYIEVIYMCSGSTRHIINGTDVFLKEGEILFLNQKAVQEIYPAGENDIAVNFIILPEFFDYGLKMIEVEENQLRDFIIDCLRGEKEASGYLHFKVADILPIQNLMENLIWTIINKQPNKRSVNQATMGLTILQLMNYMERVETDTNNEKQRLMIAVLGYIEENYREGELGKLANLLHYDEVWLSKEIKKRTGKNYTDLVQIKRLSQAAYLLTNTMISVMDVGMAVGYENLSYFHRIFQKRYGVTPRIYRIENGK